MSVVRSTPADPLARPRRSTAALRGFAEALNAGSDHACASLAGACLDAALVELCRAHMIARAPAALFDGSGPLATFAAKIELAYALGWLSGAERRDLHVVREVAAAFAADVRCELDFTSADIRAACERCELTNDFLAEAGLPDTVFAPEMLRELRTSARPRFELTIGFLRQALMFRTEQGVQPASLPDRDA